MAINKKIVPKEETHRGYNEKHPAQPQGAFEPDNKTTTEKAPLKTSKPERNGATSKKL